MNDYHHHHMWCPCKNFLPHNEYKKSLNGSNKGQDGKIHGNNNFRVVILAMVTDNKFKAFNEPF
eukprot:3914352-Ditylum_brightwellii.AAC.2